MDRPAMERLLDDVRARRLDVVLVYKIDRLSRSIGDFVRLSALFDEHGVSFVSVTQQFNTSTSVGRLTLNLLTVFAQFERETISERTRDKMRAARRRGKFVGGTLILGYDRHPEGRSLVVNETEAAQVRTLFDLYISERSLAAVAQEANARGWTTKSWTTKKGEVVAPRPFSQSYAGALLKNVAYVGKVRFGGETFPGEQTAIIAQETFDRVQALLEANRSTGGRAVRTKHVAPLQGLLTCLPCNTPMAGTSTTKGNRTYRYYVCRTAREAGWGACATKSLPAGEIERVVVEQIRAVGRDARLRALTLDAARSEPGGAGLEAVDLARALGLWDEVWGALLPKEQARVLGLLLERVEYDPAAGTISLTFRPSGIKALSQEVGG